MRATLRYGLLTVVFALMVCGLATFRLRVAAEPTVHVQLNADHIGPREIESLTTKSVPRDYGYAWQTMEQALGENRTDLLDGYFTGWAKQDLTSRVQSQLKSGLRTKFQDRGHRLEAIFYAPAGDAMQLRDRAQVDIQVLDGDKVIYDEPANLTYIVLMTPGADRWLVRMLQVETDQKNQGAATQ
jgi:hypothetical protein